ncbi:MAG TPA: DUF4097 family beta strand repeat-containing protein [Myxococcales bacterium]|nr:DUF4097 family beta strand repeat-containing protein [Myxococcales bacterium]
MIGSIALLCTLATATAPPRVHVPRIDVPDFYSFTNGAVAMKDEDEADDEDEGQADREADKAQREAEKAQREAEKAQREAEKSRNEQRRWYRDQMRFRFGDDEDWSDEKPTAKAEGKDGSATLAVKGPVKFRLRVQAGEAEVVASDKAQVSVTIHGVPRPRDLQLLQFGDRVEARIGGSSQLHHGAMRVELPKGSTVDFNSTSGDLTVQGVGGDVRVRTMSGDVKIAGARNADVQSISGDVNVGTSGPRLHLKVVSGNVVATTVDPAVQLDFESASGNLDWTGVCAKGCHVSTQTVSGQIKLLPDASKSSFELSYASHSGDLRDDLKLQVKRAPKRKHGGMGGWLEAVYGKGEGVIECDAFSGDVIVSKK